MDSHGAAAAGGGLMDEFHLMKDQKYRVYMANVDKALKNFEYSSEWADLISALGKLNKVSVVLSSPQKAVCLTFISPSRSSPTTPSTRSFRGASRFPSDSRNACTPHSPRVST